MEPFFTDYLNHLLELHGDIRGALQGLPQDALDWSPGAEMNSLSVLVVHLTGAARYWIGDVVAREPFARDRAAEFRVSGLSADELLRRLSDIESLAQRVLGPFELQALEEKCVSPRDGREYTVAWALVHALKHTALHLGQIQITRQLWEQAQPK